MTNPVYNIRPEKVARAVAHFAERPLSHHEMMLAC
jgi:hypothetical protein